MLGLVAALALLVVIFLAAIVHIQLNWFRGRLHPWLIQHATLLSAYRSLAALTVFPIIVVGGLLAFLDLRERLSPPDVELRFLNPYDVAFVVDNSSSAVAPEPKYMLALWDFGSSSDPYEEPAGLEIPVKVLDTMRPHSGLGSWPVTSLSKRAAHLAEGSRVFGFATVSCPMCLRQRTYLVYFEHRRGGWFTEVPDYRAPAARQLVGRVLDQPSTLEDALQTEIPIRTRRPIL